MAWEPIAPGESVAYGLVNPGPLAPALGKSGEKNVETLRDMVANPPVQDPTKGPIPVGVDTPNKFSRIIGMAQRPENQVVSNETKLGIAVPAAGLAAKGAGLAAKGAGRFLARMGAQGAGQAAGAAIEGENVPRAAARGVLGQAASEGIVKTLGATRNTVPTLKGGLDKFAGQAESGIVKYLQDKVPAWKGLGSLKDMFYTQGGHDTLHAAYDESLKEVIAKGAGKMIDIPEGAAKAFGLGGGNGDAAALARILGTRKGENPMGFLGGAAQTPGTMSVDAGEAAQAMTGAWKKNPRAYRAIAKALDQAGIGDPAAREAYKTALGTKSFLDRTKSVASGKLDVLQAQSGLNTEATSGQLTKRGIEGPIRNILNPGGGPLITKGNMSAPGAVLGAGAGAVGLGNFIPGYGHSAGAAGGGYLGHRLGSHIPTYRNVPNPPSPAAPSFQQLLQGLLQGQAQQETP